MKKLTLILGICLIATVCFSQTTLKLGLVNENHTQTNPKWVLTSELDTDKYIDFTSICALYDLYKDESNNLEIQSLSKIELKDTITELKNSIGYANLRQKEKNVVDELGV